MHGDKNLFKVVKWLMLAAGTWQLELVDVSKNQQMMYKIYSILIYIFYHTCHVSFLLKLYELWGVDNGKAVECLSMLIITYLLGIKMALCKTKQMTVVLKNSINKINMTLVDGSDYGRDIFSSFSHYANTLNIFVTISSFTVGLFLIVNGFLEYILLKLADDQVEDIKYKQLVLYWYPFDPQKHEYLVCFYECFTILFSDLYNSCLQSLLNTIMVQISADIKILQYKFKHFTKDKVTGEEISEQKAYLSLKKCIKSHQKLIRHTDELNKVLKTLLLIEYGVFSVIMAAILVQIISGKKPIFNSVYFLVLASHWFILAWNANEIKLQSEELSNSIYESNWYEHGKATNQLIYIMILRTRKPLYIQIGPFGAMNIDSAISRMKLAYSYVSLMS